MKLRLIFFLALILSITGVGFAQKTEPAKPALSKLPTAQEILAKYVKALGGREANEKLKSRMMTGTVEMSPVGLKGAFESYAAPQDKSYTKIILAGIGDMLEGFDGKTAWTTNPIQGSREKTGAELIQAKMIGNFYREINLDKFYPKMEVKGTETINGKEAYVVVATPDLLASETLYFDAKTGFLLRQDLTIVSPEGNQNAKIFYYDMRLVDGVMLPFKVRTQHPQGEMTMTVAEIKHGVTIDESKFAKPKQ